MERWRGRTALVTGASSGIGKAVTILLLRHGVNVVGCARRVELVQAVTEEVDEAGSGELMVIKCNVTEEEEILKMFEQIRTSKFGGVDICVNAAGRNFEETITGGKTENEKLMLSLNVLALNICTREAIKSMKSRNVEDGHIIHISSILAHDIWPTFAMHTATKHAVNALANSLRQELLSEKSSIRVSQISPGLVKTPLIALRMGHENAEKHFEKNLHLLPSDIASAVVYVLSVPKHVQVHEIILRPVAAPENA